MASAWRSRLRAARDGANIAVAAKTTEPDPRLARHDSLGGRAESTPQADADWPVSATCDSRIKFTCAVQHTVETFGGIDILINNASALFLAGTLDTPAKRFDLIHAINVTRHVSHIASVSAASREERTNPHILNLAPPLNIEARWFAPHLAYSLSKFGMSLCVLGMAEEFRSTGIAVNALWPRTAIATAAVRNLLGGDDSVRRCRQPEIVADAAYRDRSPVPSRECTGVNSCSTRNCAGLARFGSQRSVDATPSIHVTRRRAASRFQRSSDRKS